MYNVMSRKDENDVLQRMRKKLKMQHDVLLEDAFEAKNNRVDSFPKRYEIAFFCIMRRVL